MFIKQIQKVFEHTCSPSWGTADWWIAYDTLRTPLGNSLRILLMQNIPPNILYCFVWADLGGSRCCPQRQVPNVPVI